MVSLYFTCFLAVKPNIQIKTQKIKFFPSIAEVLIVNSLGMFSIAVYIYFPNELVYVFITRKCHVFKACRNWRINLDYQSLVSAHFFQNSLFWYRLIWNFNILPTVKFDKCRVIVSCFLKCSIFLKPKNQ